jgi:hypothetical protein
MAKKWTQEEIEQANELYMAGYTIGDIAEKTRRSRESVSTKLDRTYEQNDARQLKREEKRKEKYSAICDRIIALRTLGWSKTEIGKQLGLTPIMISYYAGHAFSHNVKRDDKETLLKREWEDAGKKWDDLRDKRTLRHGEEDYSVVQVTDHHITLRRQDGRRLSISKADYFVRKLEVIG